MAWVKRNLGLVIGGVVALALMGFAGYFLWAKIQEDNDVTAQLQEQTQQFQTLLNRPLLPRGGKVDNIELAKEENKRLDAQNAELRQERAAVRTDHDQLRAHMAAPVSMTPQASEIPINLKTLILITPAPTAGLAAFTLR